MYVRAHPRWKLTAQDLAIYARCSVPTLNRLFRRYLRQSPAQWMLQQRLTEAANLLGTTQISIGEIGRMVGIDDPYYFSRIFKRKYNMTPTHYRAMISLPMRG
jgi:transcriptional regulator GlxA family with amidase domain